MLILYMKLYIIYTHTYSQLWYNACLGVWICTIREHLSIMQILHLLMHNFTRKILCECRKLHPQPELHMNTQNAHMYTCQTSTRCVMSYVCHELHSSTTRATSFCYVSDNYHFTVTHKLQSFWYSLPQVNFRSLSR